MKLGLFDGAYYLAGYAVECAIKACIAKETQRSEFPEKKRVVDSHTHNLKELLKLAHIEDERTARARTDEDFRKNWDVVLSWSEQSRYWRLSAESAQKLLNAVGDRRYGAISWVKLHW